MDPSDATQGYLGDCWFIASISSFAEVPQRVKAAFLTDETNGVGVYAVELYLLGTPITVIIDDYLPFVKGVDSDSLFYSRFTTSDAVWSPLLEKAFAKYLGSYEAMNGGYEIAAF